MVQLTQKQKIDDVFKINAINMINEQIKATRNRNLKESLRLKKQQIFNNN